MHTAIHELVHIDRMRANGLDSWDDAFEEGLADAVARDQLTPFEYRLSGWHGDPAANLSSGVYDAEVRAVRLESAGAVGASWRSWAARRWRLGQAAA